MRTRATEQGTGTPAPSAPPVPALPQSPGAGTTNTPQSIVIQPPRYGGNESPIPVEVIPLAGMLMTTILAVAIGYPIVRVISRYFDRRLDKTLVSAQEVTLQIRQLQESVDTMAIELERIGEAQRFSAKLLVERSERP